MLAATIIMVSGYWYASSTASPVKPEFDSAAQ